MLFTLHHVKFRERLTSFLRIFENFYRYIIQTLFSFLYCGPWVLRRVGALVPTGYLVSFLYCGPWVLRRVGALVPTGYLVSFWYCGPWVLRRVDALLFLLDILYPIWYAVDRGSCPSCRRSCSYGLSCILLDTVVLGNPPSRRLCSSKIGMSSFLVDSSSSVGKSLFFWN